ncbi:MAG: dipeptidyl-peptidase-4 [Myxococcota bacterium]|jgi:dipeptidyl-peptidase-4
MAGADPVLTQLTETRFFTRGRPTAITPTDDGVLFLRAGPRSPVQDLYFFDAETGATGTLLTAADLLAGDAEALSAEEKARRERLRQDARGIAKFVPTHDATRLLVPLSGSLFVVDRATGAVRELPAEGGYPIDPHWSPDGTQVAVVRGRDLYVVDADAGTQTRLTSSTADTESWGASEFVAQEEMKRMRGSWWSPDGAVLAVQRTDTSAVAVWHTYDPTRPSATPQPWRYPAPGEANADVRLALIRADGTGEPVQVDWDRERYPYLATVRWPDAGPLTLLVQDRVQQEEVLLAVDPATGATTALHTERDAAWLNLDQSVPRWRSDGSGFLWSTERDGTFALELRDATGALVRTLTTAEHGYRSLVRVHGSTAWFAGGPEPTETQLFEVDLDSGVVTAVTSERGQHGLVARRDAGVQVRTFGGPDGTLRWSVLRDDAVLGDLPSVAEAPPRFPNLEYATVGERGFRAVILRPHDFEPGRRYPVLLHVYGGPHAKMVTTDPYRYQRSQWYADHGFVVVSLDGRGTPDRGREWERAVRGDLITVPLNDQIEGLHALAAAYPELDTSRVGVFGWSFGGYFSAHAVLQRPDVFHVGVAGAPVADWADYDTHYTERYMGLPADNPEGYAHGSALTHAPDLTRPLLILHGTDDDNVYFAHAVKLSDALFRAGRPHAFLPLTGYTHMVADPSVATRLQERILGFLRDGLD